jgi:methionyl-tRNA formyltransferase
LGDFGMPTLDALLVSPHRPVGVVVATATAAPAACSIGNRIRARIRPLLWPGLWRPLPRDFRPWAAPAVLERAGVPHVNAGGLDGSDLIRLVATHRAELLLSVGYPKILPAAVLEAAPRGGLNVHPSLLPRYRGPSPVFWQVAMGETRTGVTIHRLTAGVDEGPILSQVETGIGIGETAGALFLRLARLAASLVLATLGRLEAGPVPERAQDGAAASIQRRFREADSGLDWSRPAQDLARLVRACNPFPGARTLLPDGETVRIWRARAVPGPVANQHGEIAARRRSSFDVVTGVGLLRVRTATSDRGHRFPGWGRPWPALAPGTVFIRGDAT